MTLDIGRSFTYMFEDESWIMKIVVGGILGLIPIVDLMVLGYTIEGLKRSADGMDIPLPEWDDFGGKFMKGLFGFVIFLVYAIPLVVLACCALGATPLAARNETLAGLVPIFARLCVPCLSLVWMIVMAVFLPGAWMRYATTGEFMSAFQFGELFSFISPNVANYVVAIMLWAVAMFIASFGMIACFVGVFFTGFWALLVTAHVLGQVQRESLTVA